MTKKENLRKVLRGKTPQWVPFALNFQQWFNHHQKFDTLPDELRQGDYIDAMKTLGCDIFSRNVEGGFSERDRKLTADIVTEENKIGLKTVTRYDTPYGTIQNTYQEQKKLSTGYQKEYWVKNWDKDKDAYRYLFDQRELFWDEAVFEKTCQRIGDEGLVNVPCGCTPLKHLHNVLGLAETCLFIMDNPDEAKSLCEMFWERLRPVLQKLAAHPDVESVILMDNVDTPFYPPQFAAEFWTPYVKEAAALMASNGKYLFVHACGQLAGLTDVFSESKVTGLEGVSHSPLGDWTPEQAQACHPNFVFVGGFSAAEQEMKTEQEVRQFYEHYFNGVTPERFIFSSSCQTSILTSWERIKLVRDICRDWGGHPNHLPQ